MQERCYGKDKEDFKVIGDVLADSTQHFVCAIVEREKKIAEIKACPGPCRDGKVTIELESSADKVPCPVISPDCAYGAALRTHINRCLTELMTANIGVPRRLVARMNRYFETIALREATRWNTQGFLVLSGKTGCGKSYAAA